MEFDDIILRARRPRIICPFCGPGRRHKDLTLSLRRTQDGVLYNCWHCSASGIALDRAQSQPSGLSHRAPAQIKKIQKEIPMAPAEVKPLKLKYEPLSEAAYQYLEGRGISRVSADELMLKSCRFYSRRAEIEVEGVAFPYDSGFKIRSISGPKDFSADGTIDGMFKAVVPEYNGFPVICEGEMDAISLYEAGITAYSIPHGAINPGSEGGNKLECLASIADDIRDGVIVWMDTDAPGVATKEEVARRAGKAVVRVVDSLGYKDANEFLVARGARELVKAIEGAIPYPIEGLYAADHFASSVKDLFIKGLGKGASTGYSVVDDLYTVQTGQVTIVTGSPGSGKSQWCDQLMVNLAESLDWRFAVASFENIPKIHIAKLCSVRERKPFFTGPTKRMDEHEMKRSLDWVNDHFSFIHDEHGDLAELDSILDRAAAAVLRFGARGVIIDPWNSLARPGQKDMSETQFVSEALAKISAFAKARDVHVWLVAHPAKMMRGQDGKIAIAKGYDISGSAHFYNRADCGITVHRPDPMYSNEVEIHVWKCRFNWIGRQGVATLNYSPASYTYSEQLNSPSRYNDMDL